MLDIGVDGVWTLHLPTETPHGAGGGGRGERTNRYALPAGPTTPPPGAKDEAGPAGAGSRGLLGTLGRRVIKVLLFRVLEGAGGLAAERMARRWEDEKRVHRLRWFRAGSQRDAIRGVPTLSAADLRTLGSGRALLLVHGTSSLSHSGPGGLPDSVLAALAAHYDDRVFAFDHPTLSYDPVENARWFAAQLPDDVSLDLDVVAHSRGGLVTRVLAERPDLAGVGGSRVRVGAAVLVGTPNAGTALAAPEELGTLLDVVTNVLGHAPDNPVTDVLEVAMTALKHLAVGALHGLDGLASMNPKGGWPDRTFRHGAPLRASYRGIGSNYEPLPGSTIGRLVRDAGLDLLFAADNDLIVPTDGTCHSPMLTIAETKIFTAADAVDHSGYWSSPAVGAQLLKWLVRP